MIRRLLLLLCGWLVREAVEKERRRCLEVVSAVICGDHKAAEQYAPVYELLEAYHAGMRTAAREIRWGIET